MGEFDRVTRRCVCLSKIIQMSRFINENTKKNSQKAFLNETFIHISLCIGLIHMSSACPRDRTPGQPGEYIGEYKADKGILCPRVGENSRDFFKFKGKGWGNSKFCKITDGNHGDNMEICRFPQIIE